MAMYLFKSSAAVLTRVYLLVMSVCLCSCGGGVQTPEDAEQLESFHRTYFEQKDGPLADGQLNLYVDYSTCCALGQNSQFFQDVTASLVNRTTAYYSIKGSEIAKEESSDIYTLLRNINEVNYADLASAAKMIADDEVETVLLTDGEYYTQSIARGHDNDPYLTNAFKTWILKGHDIYVISEPYVEVNRHKDYKKKRFYFLFTDDRIPNNIHSRIVRTVDFQNYPEIDEFHISASHPMLKGDDNNTSIQNGILASKSKGFGSFEICDWSACDWKTIDEMIVNALDPNTGELTENGDPVMEMAIDKNSFGCYQIQELDVKLYDINTLYSDYYNAVVLGSDSLHVLDKLYELDNFLKIDKTEFDENGKIKLYFDRNYFDPTAFCGSPYNYLKVDLTINKVQQVFVGHEDKFTFESIDNPGNVNVSIASSIKQCLADQDVMNKMTGQTIYSIYIKSSEN